MNNLPDRGLTPSELRQLIESNARAIQANSAAISETRQTLAEGFTAVQSDISQLAQLMQKFFQSQSGTNGILSGALEDQEARTD